MRYINKKILIYVLLLLPGTIYAQSPDYHVKGRDVLRITIYDHPDLNTVVRVTEVGIITFPLIGKVKVKDLTTNQIEKKIANLLSGEIIVNPQVSVFVEQFKSKQVTVIGEVNRPGQYNLLMDETTYVADVISNCLGLTRDAGDSLTILRKEGGKPKKIVVNLDQLLKHGDLTHNKELKDGDLLYIPRVGYFYIYGQVNRPGYYRIESGITVIRAISMAGGSTGMASTRGIRIIRKTEGMEKTLRVELNNPVQQDDEFFKDGDMSQDIMVENGDVIYLPRAAYFYVYGQVNRPGYYKMEPGLTVIKAISIAGGVTNKASTRSIEIIRNVENQRVISKNDLDFLNNNLISKLLEEKIIKNYANDTDYVYFNDEIKDEILLKQRLEKIITNGSNIESTLYTWRNPRKEITFEVELAQPIQGEDVITVPKSFF